MGPNATTVAGVDTIIYAPEVDPQIILVADSVIPAANPAQAQPSVELGPDLPAANSAAKSDLSATTPVDHNNDQPGLTGTVNPSKISITYI